MTLSGLLGPGEEVQQERWKAGAGTQVDGYGAHGAGPGRGYPDMVWPMAWRVQGPLRGMRTLLFGHIWVLWRSGLYLKFLDVQVLAADENGKKENHRPQALCTVWTEDFVFQMRCLL